jgi:hypothetical protein
MKKIIITIIIALCAVKATYSQRVATGIACKCLDEKKIYLDSIYAKMEAKKKVSDYWLSKATHLKQLPKTIDRNFKIINYQIKSISIMNEALEMAFFWRSECDRNWDRCQQLHPELITPLRPIPQKIIDSIYFIPTPYTEYIKK